VVAGAPLLPPHRPPLNATEPGYRVVAFDQLGTGASDRPTDHSLWTIARYVAETEAVRRAMGLGRVHLLGPRADWPAAAPVRRVAVEPEKGIGHGSQGGPRRVSSR